MRKPASRELRDYEDLFGDVDAAQSAADLGDAAARASERLAHWILLGSVKRKIADQAQRLRVRCPRDPDACFEHLLRLARGQLDIFAAPASPLR